MKRVVDSVALSYPPRDDASTIEAGPTPVPTPGRSGHPANEGPPDPSVPRPPARVAPEVVEERGRVTHTRSRLDGGAVGEPPERLDQFLCRRSGTACRFVGERRGPAGRHGDVPGVDRRVRRDRSHRAGATSGCRSCADRSGRRPEYPLRFPMRRRPPGFLAIQRLTGAVRSSGEPSPGGAHPVAGPYNHRVPPEVWSLAGRPRASSASGEALSPQRTAHRCMYGTSRAPRPSHSLSPPPFSWPAVPVRPRSPAGRSPSPATARPDP